MDQPCDVDPGPLVANHQAVESLVRAVISAPRDVRTFRMALKNVLRNDRWQDHLDPQRGQRFRFGPEEFLKFVEADYHKGGCGADDETMRTFINGDVELLEMYEAAITRGRGGANNPAGIGGRGGKVVEIVNSDIVTVDNPAPDHPKPVRGNTLSSAM